MSLQARTNPRRGSYAPLPPVPVASGFEALAAPGGGDTFSFDDPLTRQFEQQGRKRIGELDTPLPSIGANPQLQAAMAALSQLMSSGGGGASGNAGLAQFQGIADKRLAQLDQPGYTGTQQDILRTNVTDPLEGQRAAAKQQVIERLAKQGIQPSSGIAQQALMDVDRSFSQQRTTGERALATNLMDVEEQRKQEAVQIGQILASLYGQDASRIDAATGRNTSTRLSAAGALGGLGQNQQQFDFEQQRYGDTRKNTAFEMSQLLSQLPMQRLQAGLGAMNQLQAPTPQADDMTGMMSALLSLLSQGTAAGNQAGAQTNALWQSIIGAIPGLAGLFGKKTGTGSAGAGPGPNGEWA